jgi:hypothetical protein
VIIDQSSLGIGASSPADAITIGNGTSSSQGIGFVSTNTGNNYIHFGDSDSATAGKILYDHANDNVQFYTGGTLRGFYNANGLTVSVNTGGVSQTSHFFTYNENGGELQLYDNNGQAATLLDQSSNATRLLEIQNGSTMQVGLGGSNTTGIVEFRSAGFGLAGVIDANGNWGINHSLAFGKLSINSNGAPATSGNMTTGLTVHNDSGGTAINIGTNDAGGYNYIQSAYVNSAGTARNLAFFAGATRAVDIDTSGRMQVGKTGTQYTTPGVQLGTYNSNSVNDATQFCYDVSGGTNMYCTAPTSGAQISFYRQDTGAFMGQIVNGASNTVSYAVSSDRRLKENIADADDAGSKVDAIQVRKFDWKADGSHQDYGMIAQELQTVAPEAVSTPENSDDMMGVDYSKLVPMLVREIQSLRARVAQLEGAN